MDSSGLLLTAYVKYPPIRECDLNIGSYLRRLERDHWDAVESGSLDKCSMNLLVDLCQHVVNLSTRIVMETIGHVTSDWHRKARRIYAHVNPDLCFFGIDETTVRANLKSIVPQLFGNAFNPARSVHCGSLHKFIRLAAREMTEKVNSRIAVIMRANALPTVLTFECNCIFFTTLHTMIAMVTQTLRCMHQFQCQCTLPRSSMARSSSASPKGKRMVIEHGTCDIYYYTSNKEALAILTEITEFWRPAVKYEGALFVFEDSNEWNFNESNDSSQELLTEDSDDSLVYLSSGTADVQHQSEDSISLQGFGPADAENQSEDSIPSASIETTSTEPSSPNDACSSESTTLSDLDDTKHRLVLLLLAGLLLRTAKKARTSLPQADFNAIVKKLRDEALREIKSADFAISLDRRTVEKTYKALFGHLSRRFGSAKLLLKAVALQDPATEDLIIQTLKNHLTAPAPTKKNAVARFFSSVGKAFAKPFVGSSDSQTDDTNEARIV